MFGISLFGISLFGISVSVVFVVPSGASVSIPSSTAMTLGVSISSFSPSPSSFVFPSLTSGRSLVVWFQSIMYIAHML